MHHNSKGNNPKVFKLGVGMTQGLLSRGQKEAKMQNADTCSQGRNSPYSRGILNTVDQTMGKLHSDSQFFCLQTALVASNITTA